MATGSEVNGAEGTKGEDHLSLPHPDRYRERYYAEATLESPMGGRLDPLTVRMEEDGSGTVILECSSSSLRYELTIPKGTRTERRKVKAVREEGVDPFCPRHGDEVHLVRVRRDLACPKCGARFGRAE